VHVADGREKSFGKPAIIALADGRVGLSYTEFGLDAAGKIERRNRLLFTRRQLALVIKRDGGRTSRDLAGTGCVVG
jgi:hypothetical protein